MGTTTSMTSTSTRIARALVAFGLTAGILALPTAASARDPKVTPKPTQRDGDQATESARISRTFEVGPEAQLELGNIAGEIAVRGVAGSTITINATKHVRPRRNEDIQRTLDDLEIEIDQRGDRIEVRTRHDRGGRRRARVDYDVTVPFATRVMLRSVSGDVEADDVAGELDVEVVSGDLRIESAGRLSVAKTVSGDIRVDTATGSDNLTIRSVSGDITIGTLEAERFELETVSGEMQLRDVTCRRLSVSTVSGEFDYEGALAADGRYELNAHSGDITLRLTEDIGFDLSADTFSGDFEFGLPVTLEGSGPGRDDRGRGNRQRSVRGRHGDGGARLEVVTFSGDLTIRTRN